MAKEIEAIKANKT